MGGGGGGGGAAKTREGQEEGGKHCEGVAFSIGGFRCGLYLWGGVYYIIRGGWGRWVYGWGNGGPEQSDVGCLMANLVAIHNRALKVVLYLSMRRAGWVGGGGGQGKVEPLRMPQDRDRFRWHHTRDVQSNAAVV